MGQPSPNLTWCKSDSAGPGPCLVMPLPQAQLEIMFRVSVLIMTITYGSLGLRRRCANSFSRLLSFNPLNRVKQVWLAFTFFRWGNCGLKHWVTCPRSSSQYEQWRWGPRSKPVPPPRGLTSPCASSRTKASPADVPILIMRQWWTRVPGPRLLVFPYLQCTNNPMGWICCDSHS